MTERVAVLGAGVMGGAVLSAILASGYPASHVAASAREEERMAELRLRHGVSVGGNLDVVVNASVILIAVKPADVVAVLAEIANHVEPNATVVSLAAGISIATMESQLRAGTAVVRAMPNTPVVVGDGMYGVSVGGSCDDRQLARVVELLETGGRVLVVDEIDQDALTAVSGSGPAYLFYLAEAMIAGGIRAGLSEEVAKDLTNQTLLGASRLLTQSSSTPAELRRRVTSPAGTTAAAIAYFDEESVMEAIASGIEAAYSRSLTLAALT